MTVFSTWSFPSIDAKVAGLLQIFLPFVIAFLASRLFYGWLDKAGLQSSGFSPTVASILSTPILAFAYHTLVTARAICCSDFHRTVLVVAVFFGLPFLILSPLLALYLRGAFRRRRRVSSTLLFAATVACMILQFLWVHFLLNDGSF